MNSFHKFCVLILVASASLGAAARLHAQASDIPSAQASQPTSGVDQDKRGRILLDQMVEALGGDAWLHRGTVLFHGHTASFFRGAPTLSTVDFWDYLQFADAGHPQAERIEFSKKRDIVQIWTPTNGFEITYKGNKPLPADQVAEFLERRRHSVDEVVHTWLKQPGIVVLYEGTSSVERRMADKVTLLAANNDAVTLELDASTHLPLRRTYEHRDPQFKDIDEEQEQYDDYHLVHGIQTPFTISRYHNGDLANQRFIINADYGVTVTPEMFDTDRPLKKKG